MLTLPFLKILKVDPFDKIYIISVDSKLQLVFIVLNLVIIIINSTQNDYYKRTLNDLAAGVFISIFSYSRILPLTGTTNTYGLGVSGDVKNILSFSEDGKDLYPPLYPSMLKLYLNLTKMQEFGNTKYFYFIFTITTLAMIYILLTVITDRFMAYLIFIFINIKWSDLESPYKFFSLSMTFMVLIGVYIYGQTNFRISNYKIVYVYLCLLLAFLSYPAYFLWTFPTNAVIYLWIITKVIKNRINLRLHLFLHLTLIIAVLPWLSIIEFERQIYNLLTFRFQTGDDYFYEATYRTSSTIIPITTILILIFLVYINIQNKIINEVSQISLIIILNMYIVRLFTASEMFKLSKVNLWPRIDRPIVFLFECLILILMICGIRNLRSKIDIKKYNYIKIIACMGFVIYLSGEYSLMFISWFPVENNSAWISHIAD